MKAQTLRDKSVTADMVSQKARRYLKMEVAPASTGIAHYVMILMHMFDMDSRKQSLSDLGCWLAETSRITCLGNPAFAE